MKVQPVGLTEFRDIFNALIAKIPRSSMELHGAKIGVALSGGCDSFALLYLLKQLLGAQKIVALTVNHNLRPVCPAEAEEVAKISRDWGIEHHILPVNWHKGEVEGLSHIQELAREKRMNLLYSTAKTLSLSMVLMAHHSDDDMVTSFYRLAKTTRLDGMAGMKYMSFFPGYASDIILGRPMLGVSKDRLRQTCIENNLKWFEDSLNTKMNYIRNVTREGFYLAKASNPEIGEIFEKTMSRLKNHRATANLQAFQFLNSHSLIDHQQGTATLVLYGELWYKNRFLFNRSMNSLILALRGSATTKKETSPKLKIVEAVYQSALSSFKFQKALSLNTESHSRSVNFTGSGLSFQPVTPAYRLQLVKKFVKLKSLDLSFSRQIAIIKISREKMSSSIAKTAPKTVTFYPNQETIYDSRYWLKLITNEKFEDPIEFRVEQLEKNHLKAFLELYPNHPKKDVIMEFLACNPSRSIHGYPVFSDMKSRCFAFPTLHINSLDSPYQFQCSSVISEKLADRFKETY